MMHPCLSHFMTTALLMGGSASSVFALAPQAELEIAVGEIKYLLPAVGESAASDVVAPPLDPATLSVIETWRGFAWSAEKKKYLYRFAATPSSTALILTADASAGEFAGELERGTALLQGMVGAERLGKTGVAIVCATQAEYERAVEHAAEQALALTQDPIQLEYFRSPWKNAAKKSATFILPLAGIVGCVEGNSEKWSPQHEVIRGFAEAVVTGFAPQLANLLPLQIGLSWNFEFDLTGEILSMPNSDEFQFDIGRGSWSASKISSALKKIEKEVRKEQKRELELRDLPYLSRGAVSTADAAAIAWAFARHLIRHHGARLPEVLTALSEEVIAQNTRVDGDGTTGFTLAPGYVLAWEQVESVMRAALPEYRFADAAACMSSSCTTCKAWGKEHGAR